MRRDATELRRAVSVPGDLGADGVFDVAIGCGTVLRLDPVRSAKRREVTWWVSSAVLRVKLLWSAL